MYPYHGRLGVRRHAEEVTAELLQGGEETEFALKSVGYLRKQRFIRFEKSAYLLGNGSGQGRDCVNDALQPAPKRCEERAYLLRNGGRDALDALPNIGKRSGQVLDFPEDLRNIRQVGLCVLVRAGIAACLRTGKVERRGKSIGLKLFEDFLQKLLNGRGRAVTDTGYTYRSILFIG